MIFLVILPNRTMFDTALQGEYIVADSVFRTIVATSVGGIVIAGATYYFFTGGPADPRNGIDIIYRQQKVPVGLLADVVEQVNPPESGQGKDVVDRYRVYFGYYDAVAIATYSIENKSGRSITNLVLVPPNNRITAYITDDRGEREVQSSDKTATIEVLPGNAATVSMIMKGEPIFPPGKFTIDGAAVSFREVEPRFSDPLSDVTRSNPILTFWLVASGALAWAFLVIALAFNFMAGRKPSLLADTTNAESLGNSLALLNYLRIENPPKYLKAVAYAERRYKKWHDASDAHEE